MKRNRRIMCLLLSLVLVLMLAPQLALPAKATENAPIGLIVVFDAEKEVTDLYAAIPYLVQNSSGTVPTLITYERGDVPDGYSYAMVFSDGESTACDYATTWSPLDVFAAGDDAFIDYFYKAASPVIGSTVTLVGMDKDAVVVTHKAKVTGWEYGENEYFYDLKLSTSEELDDIAFLPVAVVDSNNDLIGFITEEGMFAFKEAVEGDDPAEPAPEPPTEPEPEPEPETEPEPEPTGAAPTRGGSDDPTEPTDTTPTNPTDPTNTDPTDPPRPPDPPEPGFWDFLKENLWIVIAAVVAVVLAAVLVVVSKKKKTGKKPSDGFVPVPEKERQPVTPDYPETRPVNPGYPETNPVPPVYPETKPVNPTVISPSQFPPTRRVDYPMEEEQVGMRIYAIGVGGVMNGKEFLVPQSGVLIGRATEANIRYPEDTKGVSRRHCQIFWKNGVLMLMDVGSSAGTVLRGKGKLPANAPVAVVEGDVFYLGSKENGLTIRMK